MITGFWLQTQKERDQLGDHGLNLFGCMAEDRDQMVASCEQGKEFSGSKKCGECLH